MLAHFTSDVIDTTFSAAALLVQAGGAPEPASASTFPTTAVVIVGAVLALAGLLVFFAPNIRARFSRRSKELAKGQRRFHWAVIAAYQGASDPSLFVPEGATQYLQRSWSTKSAHELQSLIERYRKGEVSHGFDGVRIAWLAEVGRAAGWLAPASADAFVEEAAERVFSHYRSWDELLEVVNEGARRWWAEVARAPRPTGHEAFRANANTQFRKLFGSTPWALQ